MQGADVAPRGAQRGSVRRAPDWLPVALGSAFALEFLGLAWSPHDRGDWLLENLLAVPFAAAILAGRRRLPFSPGAWVLVFAFLSLHEIGSHYTYSRVPWMEWSRALLGWAPSWERNHYDRFLHLGFGLLLTVPVAQLLGSVPVVRLWLRYGLAVCVMATCSGIYELLEWLAARAVDPALGIAFVGAQGDIWDAQKDMSLAFCGSLVAGFVGWWLERRRVRRAEVSAALTPQI